MEAAFFLLNEPTGVGVRVSVGIETDKLAAEQEPSLDFIFRHVASERSAHKLPIVSFNLAAPLEGFCPVVLAGLAEIVRKVAMEARLETHTPVPPRGQR
jgi:hypothetical protein